MPHRLAALAAAALLAVGCGATALSAGRDRTLRIAVSEYRINPAAATALAGRLTLVVHNYGRLAHNLAINRGDDTLASTQPLPPGAEATLTVSLPPGGYLLESTLDSDATLGATATLQVK